MDDELLAQVWRRVDRGEIPTFEIWHPLGPFGRKKQSPVKWVRCEVIYDLTPEVEAEGCFLEGNPGYTLYISRSGMLAISEGWRWHWLRGKVRSARIVDAANLGDLDPADGCLRQLLNFTFKDPMLVPGHVVYLK